jgi:hypothetical protein
MSADFEVEMVLVGEVLLITRNLLLVREFLTTSTAILARSVALGTRAIPFGIASLARAFTVSRGRSHSRR